MSQTANNILVEPCWENFNDIYLPFINDDQARSTEIFYGGSSSGKSNFVAHRAILNILSGGHNYLCLRRVANTISKSITNELQKAIIDLQVAHLFNIVPSMGHITCSNGYQLLFVGMDDPEKVKSITPKKGVITDVWYEEATEANFDDLKQLRKRLRGLSRTIKRIILSFNPIYKTHWLVREFFTTVGWKDDQEFYEDDDLRILKTTHIDNKFLTQQDRDALENEKNPYWYEVYTLGNWGILGDSIFTDWETQDLTELAHTFDKIRNGLDFGYSADPNAYVRCHYDKKNMNIYIFKAWQARGMTNPQIAAKLKDIDKEPIFCDSAEPKSIAELQADGIDARAVKKGKDSVLHGIKWLQKHTLIVDESLQGVVNELNTYQWKKDKDGNSLPIPTGEDHFIDAIRYALEIEHSGFFEGLV